MRNLRKTALSSSCRHNHTTLAPSLRFTRAKRGFKGASARCLLGPRDLIHSEAPAVIGSRIGKPDIACVQLPNGEAEKRLKAAGLPPDLSRLYVELTRAFNEWLVKTGLERTPENTTPTPLGEFAEVFI